MTLENDFIINLHESMGPGGIELDLQSDLLPIALQARISSVNGPNFLGILEINQRSSYNLLISVFEADFLPSESQPPKS